MAAPGLKQMSRSRSLKLGHFVVEFATPGIGQILKAAGCEFALFDMEHSGFGIETVKSVLRYAQAAELPSIVRVPSKEYHHIARAADMGAEGIMLPMVNDPEEARRILDCLKYLPDGRRGVALGIAHDRYTGGPVLDKLRAANRQTTLFVQIETRDGVANANAIAAVKGVDCLWVGHFDLSCSLGIPGQFDHPDFRNAIRAVAAACRKHDKALGRVSGNADEAVEHYKTGFDFLCYSGDVWLFQAAIAQGLDDVRRRTRRNQAARTARRAGGRR